MPSIRVLSLVIVALANLPLLAQSASPPGLPANAATNRPPYQTQVRHVDGPGLLPADLAHVTFGTNKFGFVMPDGFRLETEDAQKVTLVSADLNCLLTFRKLEPASESDGELDPAYCRQLLLARRPGGKIMDEYSLGAVGRRGPAFDVRWNAAGSVPRRELVLFISSSAGVLEFSLVSSPEKFEAGRLAFSTFRLTFRTTGADGRLIMPVLSNRL